MMHMAVTVLMVLSEEKHSACLEMQEYSNGPMESNK